MEILFINPGVDYMIQRIMDFQTGDESAFWSEPLYHLYPQLDKSYATSLPFAERKNYIEQTMRAVYYENIVLWDMIKLEKQKSVKQQMPCKMPIFGTFTA